MTNVQPPTAAPRENATKTWRTELKTAKGTVSIRRSAKASPYAIQQNN